MTAAPNYCTRPQPRGLYVAFELGWSEWKRASGAAPADNPRLRARNLDGLRQELAKAKKRFGLPADAPVFTCYEAGRDGERGHNLFFREK
jgi:transposase